MKLTLAAFLLLSGQAASFQSPLPVIRCIASTCLDNSIGDDMKVPDKPPEGSTMSDMLDGFGIEESENTKKAREYVRDKSLPISFSEDHSEKDVARTNGDGGEESVVAEPVILDAELDNQKAVIGKSAVEAATMSSSMPPVQELFEEPTEEMIRNNPYMKVVSNLAPSELISKFTSSAHPRVQNAVRSTILGLIGTLPKMAVDPTTITTGQRLASLMFQLQMTGYLFKNAEYRLSLSRSLGSVAPALDSIGAIATLLGVDSDEYDLDDDKREEENDHNSEETANADGVAEDASIEINSAEFRAEVSTLRDDVTSRQKDKREDINEDLLLYIRNLPEQELRSLTGDISKDVLISMKSLVNIVMAGIGEGQIAAETVTEQSGEAMAQLCMWQLVVGYNLRELEVREEMTDSLLVGNAVGAGVSAARGSAGLSRSNEQTLLK